MGLNQVICVLAVVCLAAKVQAFPTQVDPASEPEPEPVVPYRFPRYEGTAPVPVSSKGSVPQPEDDSAPFSPYYPVPRFPYAYPTPSSPTIAPVNPVRYYIPRPTYATTAAPTTTTPPEPVYYYISYDTTTPAPTTTAAPSPPYYYRNYIPYPYPEPTTTTAAPTNTAASIPRYYYPPYPYPAPTTTKAPTTTAAPIPPYYYPPYPYPEPTTTKAPTTTAAPYRPYTFPVLPFPYFPYPGIRSSAPVSAPVAPSVPAQPFPYYFPFQPESTTTTTAFPDVCMLRPGSSANTFYTANDVEMDCAPGTMFDAEACVCVSDPNAPPPTPAPKTTTAPPFPYFYPYSQK